VDALEHASPIPHYGSKMGIDATRKWASEGFAREWPEDIAMPREIIDLVTRRWKEYGF
jgi:4-hydroxy-3-polyprenylbenzoate decarboxylase